jgi:hypothetical protein
MHLIDDQFVDRILKRSIAFPVEVVPDDLPPVLERVLRIRFRPPYGASGNRTGIRIQQNAFQVVPQPRIGLPRSVKAVSVFGCLDVQIKNDHGKYVSDPELLRERDLRIRLPLSVVKQHEGTAGGLLGVNTELNASIHHRCAKWENIARTVTNPVLLMGWKHINAFHGSPSLVVAVRFLWISVPVFFYSIVLWMGIKWYLSGRIFIGAAVAYALPYAR